MTCPSQWHVPSPCPHGCKPVWCHAREEGFSVRGHADFMQRQVSITSTLVPRFINTTTFVASLFGSGEARRGSIPRSGAVTDLPAGRQGSNEARTEKRRNPPGGGSFWPGRRCSLLTDP